MDKKVDCCCRIQNHFSVVYRFQSSILSCYYSEDLLSIRWSVRICSAAFAKVLVPTLFSKYQLNKNRFRNANQYYLAPILYETQVTDGPDLLETEDDVRYYNIHFFFVYSNHH